MSAWSDFRVTGDQSDLDNFIQECEADERKFWDNLFDSDDEEGEEEW